MISKIVCVIIGIYCAAPMVAHAQTTAAEQPSSDTQGLQSAPIASPSQQQPAQDDHRTTNQTPVQHSANQPPNDQHGTRDGSRSNDNDRIGHFGSYTPEEVTAAFTIALAIATLFLVAATIALAVATIGLYRQTKLLAAQAVKASEDTRESIGIAEGAALATARAAQAAVDAVAAERAWICAINPQLDFGRNITINGQVYPEGAMLTINWINTGRSPAIGTYSSLLFEIRNDLAELPNFGNLGGRQDGSGVVGPNMVFGSPSRPIFGEQFERFTTRGAYIIAYSKVWYKNVDGTVAESEACFSIRQNGWENHPDGQRKPRIEVMAAGPQNTLR